MLADSRNPFLLMLILALTPLATVGAVEGPPPYKATPLTIGEVTADELRLFGSALQSIMLDPDDLNFKKDYVDDPFRLGIVRNALGSPLSLLQWNYEWDAFLLERKTAGEIMRRAALDLDCSTQILPQATATQAAPTDPVKAIPELPPHWSGLIRKLERAIRKAEYALQRDVQGKLTAADLDYLRAYLPCQFTMREQPALDCGQEENGAPQRFLDLMERFELCALTEIASELADEVELAVSQLPLYAGEVKLREPLIIPSDIGPIVIGTSESDVWRRDSLREAALFIDPGGDDCYYDAVGTGGALAGERHPPISIAIELDGNDTYLTENARSCGSGILGIGMSYDLRGSDTYRSGSFSQGCGLFGIGILEDRDGDDIYRADVLCQGAGACGIGLLLDSSGRDSYHAALYAQGFGYTRGWGLLNDLDGYDAYYAGGVCDAWPTWGPWLLSCSQGYAFGIRPVASGGIGILHDRNGKDFYSAEVFSQGGSYWFGIGSLMDDNDNDQYVAGVYSQGAGVHLSAGMLLDRAGDDNYTCDHQAQGFAHDYSVGWLIDEAGNDNYSAKSNAQGCAVTNSVAVLLDRCGNDGYLCVAEPKGQSYGELARGFGNIGVQLDMGGKDAYSYEEAYDGAWWSAQSWYVGIDVGDDWWRKPTPVAETPKTQEDAESGDVKILVIPGVDR